MFNYAEDFLKTKTAEDVAKTVRGELKEHSTEFASYAYGNGELLVWPADSDEDEPIIYFADDFGFGPILVEG